MCLAQQKLPQAAGTEKRGPLAAEDGRNRKERGKSVAEVVAIASLVGMLVGWTIAGIWVRGEMQQLRERLDVLGMLLAKSRQTQTDSENKSKPRDHPLTAAAQFAGNTLVRTWWLGEQGRKRAQKEE